MSDLVMQAELPLWMFKGLTTKQLVTEVCCALGGLLTFSDRLVVQEEGDGRVLLRSPVNTAEAEKTALITMRWGAGAPRTSQEFWQMTRRSYEALSRADSAHISFPGPVEVILKDRKRETSPNDFVPYP